MSEGSFTAQGLVGGVVRVSHAPVTPEAQQSLPAGPSCRVVGHTLTHSTASGEVTRHASGQYTQSFDGTPGGSVLATMRSDGPYRTVELVPGVPASRTQLSVALREGVLREVAPGIYEDARGAAQQPASGAPAGGPGETQPEPQEAPSALDPEDLEAWAEDIESLPQHAYDAAVASVTMALMRGIDPAEAAKALSVNAAIEPELAAEYVREGVAMHERGLAKALEPLGIAGESKADFYAWLRDHPGPMQEALQGLVHRHDASAFLKLAGKWKQSNPGDLSAWHSAGFETHVDEAGQLLVKRQGQGWVSAAALAGSR